jgi:hypothetical protein
MSSVPFRRFGTGGQSVRSMPDGVILRMFIKPVPPLTAKLLIFGLHFSASLVFIKQGSRKLTPASQSMLPSPSSPKP